MAVDGQPCQSCDEPATFTGTGKTGWFYWFCFPGCMPDSEAIGPFDTEAEALADARENSGTEDTEDTEATDGN